MKITELRIGNILLGGIVNGIYGDKFSVNDGFSTWFSDLMTPEWLVEQPIPLTQEWLLKLGFECTYINFSGRLTKHFEKDEISISDPDRFSMISGCELQIKYVHQLQNLYFAISGQELKPKL